VTLRGRPDPGGYSAPYVEDRLERAGRTLLALPWAGCFPAGFTCLWPEVAGGASRRYAVPSISAVSAMDEAYRWITLITDPDPDRLVMIRSLVLRRSLVIPDSPEEKPEYCYRWRDLQRSTGLHRDTLRDRWGRGIDLIVGGLNRPAVYGRESAARSAIG
jgi:hypothetical protein